MSKVGSIVLQSVQIHSNPIKPIPYPIYQELHKLKFAPTHQQAWMCITKIISINKQITISKLLETMSKLNENNVIFNKMILLYTCGIFMIPWVKIVREHYISKKNNKGLQFNIYSMHNKSKAFIQIMLQSCQYIPVQQYYPIWRGIWQSQLKKYGLQLIEYYTTNKFYLRYKDQIYQKDNIKMPSCLQFITINNNCHFELKYNYPIKTKGINFKDFTSLLPLMKKFNNEQFQVIHFINKFITCITIKLKIQHLKLNFYYKLNPQNIYVIYEKLMKNNAEEYTLDLVIGLKSEIAMDKESINLDKSIYLDQMLYRGIDNQRADYYSVGIIILEYIYNSINPHFSKLMKEALRRSEGQEFIQQVYDILQNQNQFLAPQIKDKVKQWLHIKDFAQKERLRQKLRQQKPKPVNVVKTAKIDNKQAFKKKKAADMVEYQGAANNPELNLNNIKVMIENGKPIQRKISIIKKSQNNKTIINNKVNNTSQQKVQNQINAKHKEKDNKQEQEPNMLNEIQFTGQDLPFQQKKVIKIDIDPEDIGRIKLNKERQVLLVENLKNYQIQEGREAIYARVLSRKQQQKQIQQNMSKLEYIKLLTIKKQALNEFVVIYQKCGKCLLQNVVYYGHCNHMFCFKCIESHILNCLERIASDIIQPIKCLYCKQFICEELFLQFTKISPHVSKQYRNILLKLMAHTNLQTAQKLIGYCPQPSCTPPLLYYSIDHAKTKMLKCYMCCNIFCLNCKKKFHFSVPCFDYQQNKGLIDEWIDAKLQSALDAKKNVDDYVMKEIKIHYQDIIAIQDVIRNLLNLIWCVNKIIVYNNTDYVAVLDTFQLIQIWIGYLAQFYIQFQDKTQLDKKNQTSILKIYSNLRVVKYKCSQLYYSLYDSAITLQDKKRQQLAAKNQSLVPN